MSCPTKLGQLDNLKNWFVPTYLSSSDYFNFCDSVNNLGLYFVGVPKNGLGFQQAKSGEGYIGLIFFSSIHNAREYASIGLKGKLQKGKLYMINIYVSLAEISHYTVSKADIGIYLSKDSIEMPQSYISAILPFQPQVVAGDTSAFLADTINWIDLSFSYKSKGGEKYLNIGNFNNDLITNYRLFKNKDKNGMAYYYIDDVSLHEFSPSYNISLDTINFYNHCYDSLALKITNSGDSAINFTVNPDTLVLELKQNGNVVQSIQKILNNNQNNPHGLPLEKDSSFWTTFAPLNYSGNSSNYTVSITSKMAADSFPPDNFIEVPALSVGSVSISTNILCKGDSVALYSQNVNGDGIWQFSKDKQNWQNLGFADSLVDYPQTKGYYRLAICNKVYSDTLAVDLDKKDISLKGFVFPNFCKDSVGVKIVNRGCFALDFSQNPLNLFFNFKFKGQNLQQKQLTINTNNQNPLKQPLAADSSFIIYFSPLSYAAGQGNYTVSIQANMAADGFFQNNYIESTFNPYLSVGIVSIDTTEICAGDSIVLFRQYASESASWQFSPNKQQSWQDIGFSDTLVYTPKESGFFRLAVCELYSDTLEINVKTLPPVINANFQFCNPGQEILQLDKNDSISNINWYKTPQGGNFFHQGFSYTTTINESITYYLESVKNECVSKERGTLKITLGGCELEIPNIFTPNGDGINDIFEYRQGFGKEIKTTIYNRWGEKIEEFTGSSGWSGKGYNAGTYFYVIEADGEVYRGSIMLVR